jgi:D-psicose/D-tagatose/L-ribulose 3-epimerase
VRFGVNGMAWAGEPRLDLVAAAAGLGFDGLEVPLFDPTGFDPAPFRGELLARGLGTTVSTALPRGASLLLPSEATTGRRFLHAAIDVAGGLDADVLCGPLYHPVGAHTGAPPTADEWRSCVAALRAVADHAADRGLLLAIEPLNRFETHFLNTAASGRRLVDEVAHPAVGLLLDTFHMQIEESSTPSAIATAGDRLYHVHCSENDRGVVGSGQVPWAAVRDALREIGYGRWMVCETFNGQIPALAAATAIWRRLAPDPESYARESLAFLRRLFG